MTTANPSRGSIRHHIIAGLAAMLLLVAGVGGWAVTTELAGAVVASGQLVVESNVKKVQHPTGGVVGELRVRDGDRVATGDLLVRLDDTVTRANLAIVVKSLDENAARQARFEAERDGADAVVFPDRLTARSDNPDVARLIAGEQKLFELRRSARQGQKAQLRERVAQLQEEIQGLAGQVRFAAFNQRTTPELNGIVTKISADITQDQKTGATFYVLRITMPPDEIARLNGLKLVPGMPVEAFVQTDERTVMSYLVKPLHDQIMKAFRER